VARSLDGIRIVSTAVNVPGPVAAAALRDLGATIVKIEPPSGDPLAAAAPAWYAALCEGVQVRRIDLKADDGPAKVRALLEHADLLLTATRPAALERLGLSWTAVHAAHPRVCQVAIVGYPAPRQDVAGHDLTYQTDAGLVTPPAMPRTLIADLSGAQRAVIAALDLLMARERHGEAGYAEVALSDAAASFAAPFRHGLTTADGWLGGASAAYNIYRARESWVAVAALEPHFSSALAKELGVNIDDRDALAAALAQRTADEWEQWAVERGLPLAAVRGTGA
jgi:crotonobetainyl-CoA:carnitine CoA-transferase CaiB-like acyl-CoA transferase